MRFFSVDADEDPVRESIVVCACVVVLVVVFLALSVCTTVDAWHTPFFC